MIKNVIHPLAPKEFPASNVVNAGKFIEASTPEPLITNPRIASISNVPLVVRDDVGKIKALISLAAAEADNDESKLTPAQEPVMILLAAAVTRLPAKAADPENWLVE